MAVVRSFDFDATPRMRFVGAPADMAPRLAALRTRYIVGDKDRTCTYIRADSDAHCFSPDDSIGDFEERLRNKLRKSYAVDGSLWLALVLDYLMQVPMLSLEAIEGRVPRDIGQFERLYVGTLERVVVVGKAS